MKENNLRRISNRDKVLLRPARYIGNTQLYNTETYIFNGEKFNKEVIDYVPGLIKIVREVIDNSIDEAIRTNNKFANEISITNVNGWITVTDNGRGIPIKLLEGENPDNLLMPEGAWCELNTGSNFDDDDDNTTMGQNGEGVALTNIFSKEFIGKTYDGKKSFEIRATNNLESYESKSGTSKKMGTIVSFLPDYNRFGVIEFDSTHEKVLMSDLLNLSFSYPKIKFSYNNKVIKVNNFKEYCGLFGFDTMEISETRNLSIAIMPNQYDNFEFVHYINGLNVHNGGKPLEWATKNVIQYVLDKLVKKYPNIKTGDIKNKLFAVVVFQNMINPRFEDQIKSICSNRLTDFKSQIDEPDWEKYAQKILKNNDIIEPITDVYRMREELQKRKELQSLEKKPKKRIASEKYLPPTEFKKYLMITEGASATGGLMPVLGRKEIGYYELKGKPLNTMNAGHDAFMANPELKELYEICQTENYQFIIWSTDQDLDGIHIRGLGITFSYMYLLDLLKKNRIGMLQTPLLGIKKNNKLVDWVYRIDDLTPKIEAKGVCKYYKGLGSWKESDLKEVVQKDGINKMIDIFEFDDKAEETIIGWFDSNKVDFRKKRIQDNEFSLIKL